MSTDSKVWKEKAKRSIKAALTLHGISYSMLASEINKHLDGQETEKSVSSKISRGSFSHAFYLKCMKIIEIKENQTGGAE